MTIKRNQFKDDAIVNLSRNYVSGQKLSENHGVIYVWTNKANDIKCGEIIEGVKGKTPQEAFNHRYSDGSGRGAYIVHFLFVFDINTVKSCHAINKKGFDKKLHSDINYYHATNSEKTPFFVDVHKKYDSNEEFLHGFDVNNECHWKVLYLHIKAFLDPANEKYHAKSLKARLAPRNYQISTLHKVESVLKNKKRCLLHAFPGWGKSTMGLYAAVKQAVSSNKFVSNTPVNILVSSPVVDTLEGFVESATAVNYFDKKINVYTTDSIVSMLNSEVDLTKRFNAAKGEINLFVLSVQGIRYADPDDNEIKNVENTNSKTKERMVRERYSFLNEIELFMQISDERHTEYNGVVTAEIFDQIKAEYNLDLTATPHNLLQSLHYAEDEVVCASMLHALREKKNGSTAFDMFPELSIVSVQPEFMVENSAEFKGLYSNDEDWDPRKLFDRSGNAFTNSAAIKDFFQYTIGRNAMLSLKKNPMSVLNDGDHLSDVSKNTIMVVIPEGFNGTTAEDNATLLVDLLNNDAHIGSNFHAVTSYGLTKNRKIKPKEVVEELRSTHGKNIIVVTHRKMTTGSDVPPMGCIIMLDKMSSPSEFEQLLGRMFRVHSGKEKTAIYIFCPSMNLKHVVYNMARDAAEHENDDEPPVREMFDCLPITMVGTKRTTMTYEDAYKGVLEETKRLMSGEYYTSSFFDKFDMLTESLQDIVYCPIGKAKGHTKITEKNKAKISFAVNKKEKETPEERKARRSWKETMTLMLNEAPMVGYTTNSKTVEEIFQTDLAKLFFVEENCEMMLAALNSCKDFKYSVNLTWSEIRATFKDMPFEEIHDRLFRNEQYKSKQGLVYVPASLARKMLKTKNIHDKYKKAMRNNEEFAILVPNALSGMIPVVARELYPEAKIVCAEYFPYYVEHLSGLGFEVFDLEGTVENLDKMGKKFDVVIGNPPYQDTRPHGKKITGNGALWVHFTVNCLDLTKDKGHLLLVTPDSWTSPTFDLMAQRKSLFRDYFRKYNLKFVDMTASSYFPGVGISVAWYHLVKEPYTGHTAFKHKDGVSKMNVIGINFIPKDLSEVSISIHKKVLNPTDNDRKFVMRWQKQVTNNTRQNEKNEEFKHPLIDCHSGKPVRWAKNKDPDQNIRKILLRYVGNYEVISDFKGKYGAAPQVSVFYLTDEEENAIQVFNSSLYKYIMQTNKWTQYILPNVMNLIKHPDLTQTWTDEELYEHFGLTQEEIDYIEATIKSTTKRNQEIVTSHQSDSTEVV